jgi:hypothetical protein
MAMIFLKSLGHLSEKPVIRQLAEAIESIDQLNARIALNATLRLK